MTLTINCDMGEGFGLYQLCDDEAIMPNITHANIACGFHASDPNWMLKTVKLAKQHGVHIGAHFSLPDLSGFGRREMVIERDEIFNIMLYQVGALGAFLDYCNVTMSHLKPHGALYAMALKQEHIAQAICDIAEIYKVPVFGISDTVIDTVCQNRGIEMQAEFFADLEYNEHGHAIMAREHPAQDPVALVEKCKLAINEKKVMTTNGTYAPVNRLETMCVHSDTPNTPELLHAMQNGLKQYL